MKIGVSTYNSKDGVIVTSFTSYDLAVKKLEEFGYIEVNNGKQNFLVYSNRSSIWMRETEINMILELHEVTLQNV